MSSLDIVRQLISDAIWAEADVSKEFKLQQIDRMEDRCTSLETARVFITMRRLVVVIPEDLANAIQAEANSCVDDHRASLALEAEGVTWSDFTPEPTDSKNRNYSEDRTELGDELNSQLV